MPIEEARDYDRQQMLAKRRRQKTDGVSRCRLTGANCNSPGVSLKICVCGETAFFVLKNVAKKKIELAL